MQVNLKKISKLIFKKKWSAANQLLEEVAEPLKIFLQESEFQPPFTGVEWVLQSKESCGFVFNQQISVQQYQFALTRLILLLPLIKAFHVSEYFRAGSVLINLGDLAQAPGLALCSNRSDSILIPDTDFWGAHGYEDTRLDFMVNSPPWNMRSPIAFWRGNTTGMRVGDSWRGLPRLQLCELANQTGNRYLFDVGVSSFAQVSKQDAREIRGMGYEKGFVPITSSNRYKYLIDIDGNTNAWSALFQKLLSGSAVLKVASPGHYRQWYYDQLIPWVNFVPVKSDMSDLVEKIHWLRDHDDEAKEIGVNGAKLAYQLTYERELEKALVNINKALN
ncbi:glycosyl transferase family 90 [Polynucleobacter sinensis]|uniref:glycosyl transferase family 90 n=1 Tax=Polynucleobacter sinensis TaxID=1743157 RepID=UPI0007848A7A|nr:glycosyl transferase family 90 [Polynucleobacter sinensis]